MDTARKLLGAGDARVSAGIDLADKDFGHGYGVHVSVSLNCEQKDKTVADAMNLAKEIAHGTAEEHYEEAAALFEFLGTKK